MESEKYTEIGKDIIEFIDCVERCVKPHNMLLYNIIMNALEMMVVRYEDTDKVIGFETINGSDAVTINAPQQPRQFKIDIPDEIKADVDDIIDDVYNTLKSETEEK